MKELICSKCGEPRNLGRRLCQKCYLIYNAQIMKKIRLNKGRYMYSAICPDCKKPFQAWRKTQLKCGDCYKEAIRLKDW